MCVYRHHAPTFLTQERNLALQSEGVKMRVASDQPHFLAIDEDIFGTGLVLYYLHVRIVADLATPCVYISASNGVDLLGLGLHLFPVV